jgi:hypothetical protein
MNQVKTSLDSCGFCQIFIVWPNAMQFIGQIISQIQHDFVIEDQIRINWNDGDWGQNLARFYGKDETDLQRKKHDIGCGPFVAVITRSNCPQYDYRYTSRGFRKVQTDAFDCKEKLRNLVGGEARIHCSTDEQEFRRDTALLLGTDYLAEQTGRTPENPKDWQASPAGANGWKDFDELFQFLNASANYLVMRDRKKILGPLKESFPDDIDFLTDSRSNFNLLVNGRPADPGHPARHYIVVAGLTVQCDIREIGDGYCDSRWQEHSLNERIIDDGIYVPNTENHFYMLLYHCLLHKPYMKLAHFEELTALSASMSRPFSWQELVDRSLASGIIARFISRKRYSIPIPADPSVPINQAWNQKVLPDKEITTGILGALSKSTPVSGKKNDYFLTRVWCLKWYDGRMVAVKNVQVDSPVYAKYLFREGLILRKLGGEIAPEFVFEATGPKNYILVSTWIDGKSLQEALQEEDFVADWAKIHDQIYDIRGQLLKMGIRHNDMRPENLIISDTGLRLIDFGWSCFDDETPDDLIPVRNDEDDFARLVMRVDQRRQRSLSSSG